MSNSNIKVVGIKRHAYAPEMNRAQLSNGNWIAVPSCKTIAEAQEAIEALSKPKPLYAVMNTDGTFSYTPQHPHIRKYG